MNITRTIVTERDRALLGSDYAAYHAQATRKIHILRKRLGSATPRGRKYTPKSPVTVDNVSQNAEWVSLLLASSERAWADAMTMKTLQSPENTQRPMPGSTKKQIVSRHRRAISYATNLVEVISDSKSGSKENDILEAKAYLAMLKGALDFEQSRWTSCIGHYAVVRLIYVALDVATKSDIYKELLANTVDPSIKYAAYQSKLPRTKAVSDIAIENFPTTEQDIRSDIQKINPQAFTTSADKAVSAQSDAPTDVPTTIVWRSRKVKIEDASVSQALGIAYDKETALGNVLKSFGRGDSSVKELAAAYEEVIDARQEAVDVTKEAIDDLRSQGVEQGDNRIQSLQITRTAVNFAVIEWRIGRNRILCGRDDGLSFDTESLKRDLKPRKDGKPRSTKEDSSGRKLGRLRERVALYDSILQSLEAIKELPGVVADTQLVQEVDNKAAYFRSLKCLTIGRSHALNSGILDALALFSRANQTLAKLRPSQDLSDDSAENPTKLDITPTQLKAAQKHIVALEIQYQALAELKTFDTRKPASENVTVPPLIERFHLNQYSEDVSPKNLVNYPPRLQPIPVKPLFFDLAWNYIRYPGQQAVAVETVEQDSEVQKTEEKPTKRGWFGFGR